MRAKCISLNCEDRPHRGRSSLQGPTGLLTWVSVLLPIILGHNLQRFVNNFLASVIWATALFDVTERGQLLFCLNQFCNFRFRYADIFGIPQFRPMLKRVMDDTQSCQPTKLHHDILACRIFVLSLPFSADLYRPGVSLIGRMRVDQNKISIDDIPWISLDGDLFDDLCDISLSVFRNESHVARNSEGALRRPLFTQPFVPALKWRSSRRLHRL